MKIKYSGSQMIGILFKGIEYTKDRHQDVN